MSIQSEKIGSVTVRRFDRPDRKNAITGAMYAALADGLNQAAGEAFGAFMQKRKPDFSRL